jgi:hypothetical protein
VWFEGRYVGAESDADGVFTMRRIQLDDGASVLIRDPNVVPTPTEIRVRCTPKRKSFPGLGSVSYYEMTPLD